MSVYPPNRFDAMPSDERAACETLSRPVERSIRKAGWRVSRAGGEPVWVVAYRSPRRVPARRRYGARPGTWDDHGVLWRRPADGCYMYTAAPYSLSTDELRDLLAFCDEWALDVTIGVPSIYYPARCVHIEILPKGKCKWKHHEGQEQTDNPNGWQVLPERKGGDD